MSSVSDDLEAWAFGSADLPADCRRLASQASHLLAADVIDESVALIGQGYVLPSRESLLHASEVFANLAALPGGEGWLRRPDPRQSMHLICAVSGALQGLEAEWDMGAFSSWWVWRDDQVVLARANAARAMVNRGQLQRAIELLCSDIDRAEREYGASR